MPMYSFQLDDGTVVDERWPIQKAPRIGQRVKLQDGREATRIIEDVGRKATGEWTVVSEKHACLPEQLPEQIAEDRRRGWYGERTKYGEPIFKGAGSEAAFAKAYGLRNSKSYT